MKRRKQSCGEKSREHVFKKGTLFRSRMPLAERRQLLGSLLSLVLLAGISCSHGSVTRGGNGGLPAPLLDKLLDVQAQEDCPGSERVKDEFIAALRERRPLDSAARIEFYQRVETLRDIQKRWERSLLEEPGVSGIGVTIDENGAPMFIVFAKPSARVPKSLDGVAVRVEDRGPVSTVDSDPNCGAGNSGPPCHIDKQPLPVGMGNSGRWIGEDGGCTLGFKACDPATGETVFVTNSHCAQFANGCALAPLGDPVKHPSLGDASALDSTAVTVGEISGHAAPSCGSNNNFVDATRVTSACTLTSRAHRDIGVASAGLENPVPGDQVQYSGRTSGFNYGTVLAVGSTIEVPASGFCCGELTMHDQVVFDNVGPIQGGDSGSGVLGLAVSDPNFDRRVLGLLWGKYECGGIFNRVSRVLDALNLTLDFSNCSQAQCTQ